MGVHLEPVTAVTVRDVCDLRVDPSQERFVASNAVSLAEAQFHPQAWCRAVYDDDDEQLVGFVMLHDPGDDPPEDSPGWMIWRLMIDARFQGRGLGRQAVQAVLDHVRATSGGALLRVGAHQGEGGPQAFYESLGFVPTGEMIDGEEVLLSLPLREAGPGDAGTS